MKKHLIAAALAAVSISAHAEISANLSATSDYRFRGISQTQLKPALQGGVDYNHQSGFYAGTWASNVATEFYPGGRGLEVDVYGGYRTELAGLGLDAGLLKYNYPGTGSVFDTTEAYAAVSTGPFTGKVSYSTTDYFGIGGSKGTLYYDLTVSMPAGPVTLSAHAGYTDIAKQTDSDYADFSLAVSSDLAGATVTGKWHMNSLKDSFKDANTVEGKKLYKDGFVISITKTF